MYVWTFGAFLVFIPLTFMVLRSDIADDLGLQLVVDTANICDGPGRIHLFTGSETCVEIQEENADNALPTKLNNATGAGAGGVISPIETAETPIDANIAEIRLDMTTTLALAVLLLIAGVLVSMTLWWWRNRNVRDIEVV